VVDDRRLAALKMGAMVAVGRGSETPARLIVLEHRGRRPTSRPIVLIGKALTTDTGGYSIKLNDTIPDMKYDKCGGMAVLAAMVAAARLKIAPRVVGLIAAAENMIDRQAYRPGDILTAMNGKTIEVISTDAEGRLVLADAMCYAQRFFSPRAMIDLATLTGACMIALGNHAAGLFSNDDRLAAALTAAGEATGDRVWRLPLWPAYRKQIKGDDADIKNTGGRPGGAITAAMFLKEFVADDVPWAHLDIAGVANSDKDDPICPKGATGFGVRMLMKYLQEVGA
jgi:leucyl aminopeptidase